jgi:hypothetical protein
MKNRLVSLVLMASVSLPVQAQYLPPFAPPNVGDIPVKISDPVWAVYGFPNIGLVVGAKAVLVVDTGLDPAMALQWRKSLGHWGRARSCFSPRHIFIRSTRPATPDSPEILF